MEKVYQDDDEIEIDLRELLFEMKKKIWFIIAGLLIGAAITGAYSKFLITPQYKSEAKLYVLSKETTLTSLADLQIGSQLTQDYMILVKSRTVTEKVISDLGQTRPSGSR
jgi:capsular polysaccharide biosynthesis protein